MANVALSVDVVKPIQDAARAVKSPLWLRPDEAIRPL